jgi:hypothetical protein
MKMKNLLPLSTLLLSATTLAQSPEINHDNVFWLSGEIGTTDLQSGDIESNNGQELALKVGFDVNQYVALYTGFSHTGQLDIDDLDAFQAGVKLTVPVAQDWSVFTTLGGYSALGGGVTHQVRGNAGLGVNYQITPQFGTHLSLDYKDAVSTELRGMETDTVSVAWGLSYRFGQPKYADNTIGQVNVIQDKGTSR